MIKNILFMIFIFHSFLILADTEVDPFVDTLDKFETYCIDQNDELREDVYIRDEFFSCRDTLEYLQVEFENREELMSSNPDVYKQFQDCVEERENPKIIPLLNNVQEVTDNLTCNKAEKKEFEKDCGRAWECNKLRAIKDGASLLPKIIRKPIQKFVKNSVKKKNYDQECIADGKSNCIKDFVYAFAANLWSSASSVWELVSKGTKSLFDIGGWFDDESDKLHAKAIQSKKDVEDFWDDPGKWFSNLIDNIKRGVDDWVKTSVFCGKWEGKPQFSKCLQPLENYDCIDCDDKINATCVAIGAISSEVGVAFLTAGVGTAANLTARAGAKTLAAVATKVSSKVKVIAPSFSKVNKVSSISKVGKAVAIAGSGLSKTTEVAKKIYSISSEKALRLKEKMDNISKAVNSSKVVMVTKTIVEKGNIPGRISDKIAEKGVLAGAKLTSKVGSGVVKADADKIIRLTQRARTSSRAQAILSERTHERSRLTGHNAKATSIVRRGERVPDSPSSFGGESHSVINSGGNYSNGSNVRADRAHRSEQIKQSESTISRSENVDRRVAQGDQKEEFLKSKKSDELQKRAEERKVTERKIAEKKAEEKRRIAESKNKVEHNDEHSNANNAKQSIKVSSKILAASLATNLAAKGVVISSEQAEREAAAIDRVANGNSEKFTESLVSAKQVLGVEKLSAFSKNALTQAAAVKDMYSDSNKEQIVSEIQKSNSDLSQNEAEKIFGKRQSEVGKAYDYIDNLQSSNNNSSTSAKTVSAKDELRELAKKNELSQLDKELSSLASQRESIENSFSEIPKNIEKQSSTNIEANSAPQVVRETPSVGTIKREVSSSVPSSSGGGGISSSPTAISSSSVSEHSPESSPQSEAPVVDSSSLEGSLVTVDNELIEEAIEKSKDPSDSEDVEKEDKKRSSDLKSLLSKIGNKPLKVESGVLFTRNLGTIKTTTEESKKSFLNLVKKVKANEKVDKKYTYTIGSDKVELYKYENESFHLKINESGDVELIDDKVGVKLLNRSAFNFD